MATKQAAPLKAPPVTNLTTDGSGHSAGILLRWDTDPSGTLWGTEIWRYLNNDRVNATKIATVMGANQYLDIVEPNVGYYYWIRGINIYGKASGDWYPTSATDGIFGRDHLPFISKDSTGMAYSIACDGTWKTIEHIHIWNPTSRPIRAMALCTTTILSDTTELLSQMRGRSTNDTNFATPFFNVYGELHTTIVMPMHMYVPANTMGDGYEYFIEFWGPEAGGVLATRPGTVVTWDYEWYWPY